jgi:hypothetical protein
MQQTRQTRIGKAGKLVTDDELLNAIQAKLASGRIAWVEIDNPVTADRVFVLAKQPGAEIDVAQSFIDSARATIALTPGNATKH